MLFNIHAGDQVVCTRCEPPIQEVQCPTCGGLGTVPPPTPAPEMNLLEAAKLGATWMKEWLDENLCECEGPGHSCGRTERLEELRRIKAAIVFHEEACRSQHLAHDSEKR